MALPVERGAACPTPRVGAQDAAFADRTLHGERKRWQTRPHRGRGATQAGRALRPARGDRQRPRGGRGRAARRARTPGSPTPAAQRRAQQSMATAQRTALRNKRATIAANGNAAVVKLIGGFAGRRSRAVTRLQNAGTPSAQISDARSVQRDYARIARAVARDEQQTAKAAPLGSAAHGRRRLRPARVRRPEPEHVRLRCGPQGDHRRRARVAEAAGGEHALRFGRRW